MSAYNGADGHRRQPIQAKQKAVRKAAKRPRQAGAEQAKPEEMRNTGHNQGQDKRLRRP